MKLAAGNAAEVGRDHIIKRPRLTRLLDETEARVILLVAPAGYGKTTLAREWLADRPHGWYRGTHGNGRRGSARAGPGQGSVCGRTWCRRAPSEGGSADSNSPTEEVEATRGAPCTTISRMAPGELARCSTTTNSLATQSLRSDSSNTLRLALRVRLIVTSRSQPRWATARRVLYGEICELGQSLLGNEHEEAEQVLTNRHATKQSGLIALANGWPALIGLATLSR